MKRTYKDIVDKIQTLSSEKTPALQIRSMKVKFSRSYFVHHLRLGEDGSPDHCHRAQRQDDPLHRTLFILQRRPMRSEFFIASHGGRSPRREVDVG